MISDFLKDPKTKTLGNAIFISFLVLVIISLVLFVVEKYSAGNFVSSRFIWLIYSSISISFLVASFFYVRSYKIKESCNVGMMLGMTLGMTAGMLIGSIIGATNGFFVGAMTGMLSGSFIGAYVGGRIGVMGVMEGLMAGIMGGTMGPMISIMMFSDRLAYFMPFFVLLNVLVLICLFYLIFKELGNSERREVSIPSVVAVSIICFGLLFLILKFAPASVFFL